MKKIRKANAVKRVEIILKEDAAALVSYGGVLLVDEFIRPLPF